MSPYEPDATPQQQEAVRRLLAEARHVEPVPPELAARLDGVLAQLAAEGPRAIDPPPPPAHEAEVVDLAARRRRRVVGLLGAAAAVVVLGVGVGQLVDTSGGDDDSATSADAGADSSTFGRGDNGGGGDADAAPESAPSDNLPSQAPPSAPLTGPDAPVAVVPSISRKTFGEAVRRLSPMAVVESSDLVRLGGEDLTSAPLFVCGETSWGDGRLLAVRYDGNPAVLAYRPPIGETQVVELMQCDSGTVLRSKVIPYP